MDFGLTTVAELRDRTYAEFSQLMSEYYPDLPFKAAAMKTAPATVKAAMIQLTEDFTSKAEKLATARRS